MKYNDIDCIKSLESEYDDLNSFILIGADDNIEYYFTCSIRNGVLFNHIIDDNDLAVACKHFLIRNGNEVYESLDDFKLNNPDIIC